MSRPNKQIEHPPQTNYVRIRMEPFAPPIERYTQNENAPFVHSQALELKKNTSTAMVEYGNYNKNIGQS